MINARELRIGNWIISSATGKPIQVDLIEGGDEYEPIPLTPELLERAGFVNKGRLSEYIFEHPELILAGTMRRLFPSVWAESGPEAFGKEILYLHQLQNLYFALSGEELTINL